ncbi:MAG: hypothetical protein K0R49_787 [Burkholderiales bacterium]|jgi:hypothetical protein|nr:hypothetical protein [Burkholderiales bacterium]
MLKKINILFSTTVIFVMLASTSFANGNPNIKEMSNSNIYNRQPCSQRCDDPFVSKMYKEKADCIQDCEHPNSD